MREKCFGFKPLYIDCGYGDHVGAVEFQPHLLNGFPELPAAFWTLAIHLQDVQPCREHLGQTLDRKKQDFLWERDDQTEQIEVGYLNSRASFFVNWASSVLQEMENEKNKKKVSYRGDDEASAALVHLKLFQADAKLCEEVQTEAIDGWTLHMHHSHAYIRHQIHIQKKKKYSCSKECQSEKN